MSSESVCQVARSWVDVGSFQTRLVVRFMICTAPVRNILGKSCRYEGCRCWPIRDTQTEQWIHQDHIHRDHITTSSSFLSTLTFVVTCYHKSKPFRNFIDNV
jgi:hypothetical protein